MPIAKQQICIVPNLRITDTWETPDKKTRYREVGGYKSYNVAMRRAKRQFKVTSPEGLETIINGLIGLSEHFNKQRTWGSSFMHKRRPDYNGHVIQEVTQSNSIL